MASSPNHEFNIGTYVAYGDVAHNGGVIDRREQVGSEANFDARPNDASKPTSTSFTVGVFYNTGSHAFDDGRIFGPRALPGELALKSVENMFARHHPTSATSQQNPGGLDVGRVPTSESVTSPTSATGSGQHAFIISYYRRNASIFPSARLVYTDHTIFNHVLAEVEDALSVFL